MAGVVACHKTTVVSEPRSAFAVPALAAGAEPLVIRAPPIWLAAPPALATRIALGAVVA
jgi:hypothetical protein